MRECRSWPVAADCDAWDPYTLQALGASHGGVVGHICYALRRSVVLGLLKLRSRRQERVARFSSSMPLPAKAVANYFLDRAKRDRIPMTQMKIQKLVYIAHGWHLAMLDRPLIREKIEVWRWGPVIPDLYHDLKEFGNQPVTRKSVEIVIDGTAVNLRAPKISFADRDTDTTKILLDRVWKVYRGYTAAQLSAMTHRKGTPWQDMARNLKIYIPNKLIQKYYKNRINKNARST